MKRIATILLTVAALVTVATEADACRGRGRVFFRHRGGTCCGPVCGQAYQPVYQGVPFCAECQRR